MNFRYVNPHNVHWVLPNWLAAPWTIASALDGLLAQYYAGSPAPSWKRPLPFWINATPVEEGWNLDLIAPDEEVDGGWIWFTAPDRSVRLGLNSMLKGSPRAEGTYCVYVHAFSDLEVPLQYVGITKRQWFVRHSEHEAAARRGSSFLFHRALRQHTYGRVRA